MAIFRNTLALVLDLDLDLILSCEEFAVDFDFAVAARVFDCIFEQVQDHLLQSFLVGFDSIPVGNRGVSAERGKEGLHLDSHQFRLFAENLSYLLDCLLQVEEVL